jgi:hypothetical protein
LNTKNKKVASSLEARKNKTRVKWKKKVKRRANRLGPAWTIMRNDASFARRHHHPTI